MPTEDYLRVLAIAADEADSLGHGAIDAQHLLYGLACESAGPAYSRLSEFDVSAEQIHEALSRDSMAHDRIENCKIDLSGEAIEILNHALTLAVRSGGPALSSEHLLHSLVSRNAASASELFALFGVDPRNIAMRIESARKKTPGHTRTTLKAPHALTLDSRHLLALASRIGSQYGRSTVNSIDLLLAFLTMESPVGEILNEEFGLTAEAVEEVLPQKPNPAGEPPASRLSTELQRIIGYAFGEAWVRGARGITPAHLMMAMIKNEHPPAMEMLADLGASQADLFEAVSNLV